MADKPALAHLPEGHEAGNAECPACYDHYFYCLCGGVMHGYDIIDHGESYDFYIPLVCDSCGRKGTHYSASEGFKINAALTA